MFEHAAFFGKCLRMIFFYISLLNILILNTLCDISLVNSVNIDFLQDLSKFQYKSEEA